MGWGHASLQYTTEMCWAEFEHPLGDIGKDFSPAFFRTRLCPPWINPCAQCTRIIYGSHCRQVLHACACGANDFLKGGHLGRKDPQTLHDPQHQAYHHVPCCFGSLHEWELGMYTLPALRMLAQQMHSERGTVNGGVRQALQALRLSLVDTPSGAVYRPWSAIDRPHRPIPRFSMMPWGALAASATTAEGSPARGSPPPAQPEVRDGPTGMGLPPADPMSYSPQPPSPRPGPQPRRYAGVVYCPRPPRKDGVEPALRSPVDLSARHELERLGHRLATRADAQRMCIRIEPNHNKGRPYRCSCELALIKHAPETYYPAGSWVAECMAHDIVATIGPYTGTRLKCAGCTLARDDCVCRYLCSRLPRWRTVPEDGIDMRHLDEADGPEQLIQLAAEASAERDLRAANVDRWNESDPALEARMSLVRTRRANTQRGLDLESGLVPSVVVSGRLIPRPEPLTPPTGWRALVVMARELAELLELNVLHEADFVERCGWRMHAPEPWHSAGWRSKDEALATAAEAGTERNPGPVITVVDDASHERRTRAYLRTDTRQFAIVGFANSETRLPVSVPLGPDVPCSTEATWSSTPELTEGREAMFYALQAYTPAASTALSANDRASILGSTDGGILRGKMYMAIDAATRIKWLVSREEDPSTRLGVVMRLDTHCARAVWEPMPELPLRFTHVCIVELTKIEDVKRDRSPPRAARRPPPSAAAAAVAEPTPPKKHREPPSCRGRSEAGTKLPDFQDDSSSQSTPDKEAAKDLAEKTEQEWKAIRAAAAAADAALDAESTAGVKAPRTRPVAAGGARAEAAGAGDGKKSREAKAKSGKSHPSPSKAKAPAEPSVPAPREHATHVAPVQVAPGAQDKGGPGKGKSASEAGPAASARRERGKSGATKKNRRHASATPSSGDDETREPHHTPPAMDQSAPENHSDGPRPHPAEPQDDLPTEPEAPATEQDQPAPGDQEKPPAPDTDGGTDTDPASPYNSDDTDNAPHVFASLSAGGPAVCALLLGHPPLLAGSSRCCSAFRAAQHWQQRASALRSSASSTRSDAALF